jgi:hypothetical protein
MAERASESIFEVNELFETKELFVCLEFEPKHASRDFETIRSLKNTVELHSSLAY